MSFFRLNGKEAFFGRKAVAILVGTVFVLLAFQNAYAAQPAASQKTFKSPSQAVKALINAAKSHNVTELLAIFGPEGKEVVQSGDEVADKASRERFVRKAGEKTELVKKDKGKMILEVGKDKWPFPIPLVKQGPAWRFDTAAGKQEILNRRIGRNELNTIHVCRAYVEAQREYAAKDRDNDGVLEFAQKFISDKGNEGLYWEAPAGQEKSLMGPFMAAAAKEGYSVGKAGANPSPYHGYFYKILTEQGKNAPGGEKNYVVDGNMIAGFGLVAYPAEYGVSGIMTFMVNRHGIVFEKNLGEKTEEMAKNMTQYDPDDTWKPTE